MSTIAEQMDRQAFEKPVRKANRSLLDEIKKCACAVCGRKPGNEFYPIDPSHIRSRGAGGPDEPWNVVPKCRACHGKWGRLGAYRFCQQHPHFGRQLAAMGWKWNGYKLWHPKLGKES